MGTLRAVVSSPPYSPLHPPYFETMTPKVIHICFQCFQCFQTLLRYRHFLLEASWKQGVIPGSIFRGCFQDREARALQRLVSGYVRVSEYLASISRNTYGAGGSYEANRIKEVLAEITRYRFVGDETIYTIAITDPAS